MSFFSKSTARAAAVVFASISIASAQFSAPTNARVDALSGAHVNDISDVYRYPAAMTGYLDHVQATWGQGFVGIKSFSEMLSIGVLANQGPMAPEFTASAVTRLNNYQWAGGLISAPNFNDQVVIPHILLGFDFGAAAIGADLFLEYGGYSGQVNDTTEYSGSLSTPGFRLSGKFYAAGAEIMAKFGLGFPSINAEGPAGVPKLASDKGLYMEAGAEADIPAGNTDFVLGVCYTQAAYRFKLGDASDPDALANSLLNAYIGAEFNFAETAVAAFGYSINRAAAVASQPGASGEPSQTDPIEYGHAVYAGVENAWEKAWIFDSFQLRGGALYTVNTVSGNNKAPAPAPNPSYSQPARHSAVRPSIGVGVSKSFVTLDMSLNPARWDGLFTGPNVGMVSATVKF